MTNLLSPAAQAVLDAYSTEADRLDREVSDNEMLAAAFRAAADQFNSVEAMPGVPFCRNKLLAIANELENTND
jgi:hypothetical protein